MLFPVITSTFHNETHKICIILLFWSLFLSLSFSFCFSLTFVLFKLSTESNYWIWNLRVQKTKQRTTTVSVLNSASFYLSLNRKKNGQKKHESVRNHIHHINLCRRYENGTKGEVKNIHTKNKHAFKKHEIHLIKIWKAAQFIATQVLFVSTYWNSVCVKYTNTKQ